MNGLPSTETREVFEEISMYWKERLTVPIIISLSKGIEAALHPVPHIITPTQMIHRACENFFLPFFFSYQREKFIRSTIGKFHVVTLFMIVIFSVVDRVYNIQGLEPST